MLVIIGFLVVIFSVMGGYIGHGGQVDVLIQPTEWLIIGGAALGGFIIGNPKAVVVDTVRAIGSTMLKGPRHTKDSYLELLGMLYTVFRLAKSKGDLALESHVEKPMESALFKKFPNFRKDRHALEFVCDYLRLLTLGTSNAHELETIIDEDIEAFDHENATISGAVGNVADGLPALGIVAAVLGIIITMGSIAEPPEVLGNLIAGALVGTFLGVILAYGFVGPMSRVLGQIYEAETRYLQCIKTGILAHVQGYAPQVSVEFARKTIPPKVRPSFAEMEKKILGG